MERLMARHDQELTAPPELPFVDPGDHPMVLEGYASTLGVDAERCAFAPFAFVDHDRLPPLLLEHDHDRRAGRVESLSYDAQGQLLARPMSPTPRPAAAMVSRSARKS
jgi:hypothetical protein